MEIGSGEKRFRHVSRRAGLLALMVAWTCVSAYGQKVTYDWDKDVDFTPYRTYAWVSDLPGKAATPSTDERIRGHIDVQLQLTGLKPAPARQSRSLRELSGHDRQGTDRQLQS